VKFVSDVTPEAERLLARVQANKIAEKNGFGYTTYRISAANDPAIAAAAMRGARGVDDARPVGARYLQSVPNDPELGPPPPYSGPYTTPPHATEVQWDMYYTQMPGAWAVTTGSSNVKIAIIDTGYDANNLDVCSKVVNSAVFDNGTGIQDLTATAQDDDGHGTNVSGIAASDTNNAIRYAGAGWNSQLLEIRVFQQPTTSNPDPPPATSQDLAAAIVWAVGHGANVINLSVGAAAPATCDAVEQSAITSAVSANVLVVVASGNFQNNVLGDPADCNGVLPVGASALDDTTNPNSPVERVAGYSTYASGNTWGVVAPGGDPSGAQLGCKTAPLCDDLQWIPNNYSTTACCPNSSPPNSGNHIVLNSGTSMAAPHVAGVAALMISQDPGITPALIASILKSTTDDICGLCPQEGAGRLNATKALAATP
jgi:serine protease